MINPNTEIGQNWRSMLKKFWNDNTKKLRKYWYKRIKPILHTYEMPFFILLGVLAIILGVIGFTRYYTSNPASTVHSSLYDSLYATIQLFKIVCNPGPSGILELEIARWLAFVVVIYATAKVLLDIFYEQKQYFYLKWLCRDHIIICGLGHTGLSMVKQFMENENIQDKDDKPVENDFMYNKIVVIDTGADQEKFKKCRELGAIVLKGNATDPEMLKRVHIEKAIYLFSILRNDGDNVEIAVNSLKLMRGKNNNLVCFLHISDNRLCDLLETQKLEAASRSFSFEYFNVYDYGAQALLAKYPVDTNWNDDVSPSPHIVIIGLGKMGESVIIQAASKWLSKYRKTKKPLSITLIDKDADLKIRSLYKRYPKLAQVCELTVLPYNFKLSEFQPVYISEILDSGAIKVKELTTVYICLDDDTTSLYAAMTLYQYRKKEKVKIVVCMNRTAGLTKLLEWEGKENSDLNDLHAFGFIDHGCNPKAIIDGVRKIIDDSEIPRLMYEHYMKKSAVNSTIPSNIVTWDQLPPQGKENNRMEAKAMVDLLNSRGFDVKPVIDDLHYSFCNLEENDIEEMAKEEHKRWYWSLINNGWVWGQTKDPVRKTNPNLLPWEKLKPETKKYNYDTVKAWPDFLAEIGFQIIRTGVDDGRSTIEPVMIKQGI